LAAGLSARYGAIKPLASVGPNAEALIDYALFDAARAGYSGVVLVVREEIEDDVSRHVEELTSGSLPCRLVCQRMDDVPAGAQPPEGRRKPWGTGHAVWATRDVVSGPFAVVNADDFYGRSAFEGLAREMADPAAPDSLAITYRLADTLSTTARASRAILRVDAGGMVRGIQEVLGVRRTSSGIIGDTPDGTHLELSGEEPVSMGLWGLTSSIFPLLGEGFRSLLSEQTDRTPAEFYLSDTLNGLVASGEIGMRAIASGVSSFGVTFPDDQPQVRARIQSLVAEGHYPADLRSAFPALVNQNGCSETEP